MADETFGTVGDDDTVERSFKMAVPLRPVNMIEHELSARFGEQMQCQDAPVPFVDGATGELENAADYVARYGRPLSLDEVMVVRDLICDDVLEPYRRQLIISREGGADLTLEQYRAACALENVDPLI
jgi:hypothetical protein